MPLRAFVWLGNATSTQERMPRYSACGEAISVFIFRHRFKMSTLCTSKSQTDPIDLFCVTSCPHAANWWSKGSMRINKSQTVSVDLSAAASYSNAKKVMRGIILTSEHPGTVISQRISKRELCRANCEITLPLKPISFYHPQCIHTPQSLCRHGWREGRCLS